MNLLPYTPPAQRVRVIEHPASDAPCWRISTKEPKRLKKYEGAIRVQFDFPTEDKYGTTKSYTAFVVIDWSEDDPEDAVAEAAKNCMKRAIDAICKDLEVEP